MLIRSWALTAVIGVTVFWEESRPSSEAQEVNDEDHNFEGKICRLVISFYHFGGDLKGLNRKLTFWALRLYPFIILEGI